MSIDDRVVIRLGADEVKIAEAYDVDLGVMTQPSQFALRLGHGGVTKALLERYPPGTPFELLVQSAGISAPRPQFVGKVDARACGGAAATVTFRGRDGLAGLLDAKALADKAYKNATYVALVEQMLKDAKLEGWTVTDETQNATKTQSGAAIVQGSASFSFSFKKLTRKAIVHPVLIRAGESYYQFLKKFLDRAGMFLMAGPDKTVILMQPNPDQVPLYRIVNRGPQAKATSPTQPGNVLDFSFTDDSAARMSEVLVFGRGGGGVFGRSKAAANFGDDEMVKWALNKPAAFVDANVSSPDEAAFFARRKIAESRRQGWALSYTLAGHTTPALTGQGRLVWCRDTFVDIDDEELGITGPHYIEHVSMTGTHDRTTTTLRVMRKEDLLFGEDS